MSSCGSNEGDEKVRKVKALLLYISEWVLFSVVFLLFTYFNLINLFNLIYIDMTWEEPIPLSSSFMKSLLIVIGIGVVTYLAIRYMNGSKTYNMIRQVLWGTLIGVNTLSSVCWFIISFASHLSLKDQLIQLIILLVCAALLIQILMKLYKERKRVVPDESVYFKS